MKNKRILVTILFLLLAFVLTACSSSITSSTTNTKTTLESTTSSTIKETTKASFDVSDYILNADQYILDNLDSVGQDFRNTYHLMAPIGWINDPNGFNEFDGKYHLFYQFHPYSAEWGPMHWGHQTTTDFIKWDLEPTALAPDMRYDENGCFSGTSVVVGDRLYLAYTAVTDNQNQALAYTEDGKTFKKLDELILSGADLPEGYSNADFRDPKIFERDGKYYILCGNKGEGKKRIVMFSALAVEGPYTYVGTIYQRNDVTGIFECPDMITISGKDVLIASPQGIRNDDFAMFQNPDSCVYLVGNLSVKTNKFYPETGVGLEEFDKGFSFYAPQTMTTSDGRSILVAWMRNWSEPNLTRMDNWCGAMTLPRELTLVDNHIYQKPVREIENYLKDKVTSSDVVLTNETKELDTFSSRIAKITLSFDAKENAKTGIEVFKNGNQSTKIYYDSEKGAIVFDRMNCGSLMDGTRYCKVEPIDGKINLEIYLDVNSVEVFINGGYYTMTGTAFAPTDHDKIAIYTTGENVGFYNLNKWEIMA